MSRITGGEHKGRTLEVAEKVGTRPSSARLREALFSTLGPRVEEATVVDLFAGSGGLGIEALSRGAAHVTFVELDPRALRALGRNLQTLAVPDGRFRVRRGDARRWLRHQRDEAAPAVDLVLADPPYDPEDAVGLLSEGMALVDSRRVGVFCLEHPAAASITTETLAGVRAQTRVYGRSAFTLLEGKTQ